MASRIFAIRIIVAILCNSGVIQNQNAHSQTYMSGNDKDRGNTTKIRPFDKFRTLETIRTQALKKTTLNTVCRPKTPAKGGDFVITDMTTGSRVGPENGNFEFTKMKHDHTFSDQTELLENATVETINECVRKCTSNKDCLSYAYEADKRVCKLSKSCTPNLIEAAESVVFTMSYWYKM